MNLAQYCEVFAQAVEASIKEAEKAHRISLPRDLIFEIPFKGLPDRYSNIEDMAKVIYLNENSFYRIIDVAVRAEISGQSLVWVRVSGHPPSEWKDTWDPAVYGPFKSIISSEIQGASDL